MSLNIFKLKFGKDARDFGSVEEIDRFVEQETGCALKVRAIQPGISSSRGRIQLIRSMNADRMIDAALNK